MSAATDFRAALVKIMPGYSWTVHKASNTQRLTATGIQSSGFNRLSTVQVVWVEHDKAWGGPVYEVKSAPHGTKSPWAHAATDRTLARAFRDLQQHYERQANSFHSLAARLQDGRKAPAQIGGAS